MIVTRVVLWDIDGTLLTTARAGIFAWQDALREVTGRSVDLTDFHTAGLTDVEIASELVDRYARRDQSYELLERYAILLPSRLRLRAGHVLPGVREILTELGARSEVRQLLLTGNLRSCAFAKLSHYGLAGFFRDGSFADDAPDRTAQARVALDLARRLVGSHLRLDDIYVVGDTPHDIRCAAAIGARCVAVATGAYSRADLQEARAWRAIDHLPGAAAFYEILGLPERAHA